LGIEPFKTAVYKPASTLDTEHSHAAAVA